MSIARNGASFWICGPDASVASSSDGGSHWELRTSKANGGTLLSLRWNSETVAAAGGTGGLILLTTDTGKTWQQVPTSFSDPIIDASFADAEHGIVLTTSAVMYTPDGGKHWSTVLPTSSPELTRYKFVLAPAALDKEHAVVLVKEGPAQYYGGRLLSTRDAGATWKTSDIPFTTLNNLLVAHDRLWLVGTEVIEREKHGGHALPVTFYSRDATDWQRGPKPLIDTNYACKPEGCLMWNGAWFDPFVTNSAVHTFAKAKSLTAQWAATDDRICTLTPDLECTEAATAKVLPQEHGGPAPQLAASELRPATGDMSGKCIRCDYPHIVVSEQFGGKATVKLTVLARPDGTVSSVEVVSTPNADVGSTLARAANMWLFYPVTKDGVAVPTRRNLDLTVNVIKPH